MTKLSMDYTDKELKILEEWLGEKYEIISEIDGKCFVLNESGKYKYNDCFSKTQDNFFASQKYELVTPNKIVKFYQYYIIGCLEEEMFWYRGTKNSNGNYELDCYSEVLEEILASL